MRRLFACTGGDRSNSGLFFPGGKSATAVRFEEARGRYALASTRFVVSFYVSDYRTSVCLALRGTHDVTFRIAIRAAIFCSLHLRLVLVRSGHGAK